MKQPASESEPRKPLTPLLPQALRPADLDVSTYLVDAGSGTTPADFDMKPDLLANVCHQLHRFDKIIFYFDEPPKYAEAIVVHVEVGMALCKIVHQFDLYSRAADQQGVPFGYEVREATPADDQRGWLAIRREGGITLNKGHYLGRREDAMRYLLQHNAGASAGRQVQA